MERFRTKGHRQKEIQVRSYRRRVQGKVFNTYDKYDKYAHNMILNKLNFVLSQLRADTWAKTVLTFETDKPSRLPFVDIGVTDIGEANQQFMLEIGMACFW